MLGVTEPWLVAPNAFLDANDQPRNPDFLRGRDVYLIGEAKAWGYPTDPGRLHYRNVFDVPPGDDTIRAWLDAAIDSADDDTLVFFASPGEFDRLATTYGTPRPDRTWPPMLTMGQLRATLTRDAMK